jgi:hypothetical protein
MTLSPVFRSSAAVHLLQEEGIWERLEPSIRAQARAVQRVLGDLEELLDPSFLDEAPDFPETDGPVGLSALPFLQEYFFLILFRSLFESLGVDEARLDRYAQVNFCVKGTITAADNLFDEQAKSLLPLAAGKGSRFLSILQLMCFERLIRRTLDRGVDAGELSGSQRDLVLKGLLDLMARIGLLEGSEEGGVNDVPIPEEMVEQVHRIRGGALFALSFVPPAVLEEGETLTRIQAAEPAVARLGTAFQIVDDLTDFEFDLGRRSHNLLVAQIHHYGSDTEKRLLSQLRQGGPCPVGVVESHFRDSAQAVLERAYLEARASFQALAELGFWFPVELADEVVHAIVGLEGVRRMEDLSVSGSSTASQG